MTDKTHNNPEFSFRTFDIYRRFVEVLQSNQAYLEEFKTGSPKKTTSLAMIKKVFQNQQEKEEIQKYTQYFSFHAKMMADHAENLPDHWNDAIEYTDRYIKELCNYLRRKKICLESNLNSVEEIAEDIGKCLHDSPSERQIEAISNYLKYDLRNPKKNAIPVNTTKKIKKKSKKSKKKPKKAEIVIEKKILKHGSEGNIQPLPQMSNETGLDSQTNTSESLLQLENIETEIVVDDWLQTVNLDLPEYIIWDTNKHDGCLKTLAGLNNIESTCVEINYVSETKSFEENQVSEKDTASLPINLKNKDFCYGSSCGLNLKRKSSSPCEHETYCSLKKQLKCRRISKNTQQEKYSSGQIVYITNNNSSSGSEINVDDSNDAHCELETNKTSGMEEDISIDSENIQLSQKNIVDDVDSFNSYVKNMSYADAIMYIERVIAFCQWKNAISVEEFLIMSKTKDKLLQRSFKQKNEMQSNCIDE